jgi:hypothetical protein
MITALAVETLLVSVLAWMSIQASVTLAAMTLAMLAMMWRGETWKYECLRLERYLEAQGLRPIRLSLSKAGLFLPESASVCRDQWLRHADADFESLIAAIRLRPEVPLVECPTPQSLYGYRYWDVPATSSDNTPAAYQAEGSTVCPALYPPLFLYTELGQQAPNDLIRSDLGSPYKSAPTPTDFI